MQNVLRFINDASQKEQLLVVNAWKIKRQRIMASKTWEPGQKQSWTLGQQSDELQSLSVLGNIETL